MSNKELIGKAGTCLQNAAYSPKKLIFLHAGISVLTTFLGSLVSYLMTNSMDAASGLAGLDTRTMLSFIQTLLLFATVLALPFWELGYTRAAVLYAKNETPGPWDLFAAFRRFFPVLRKMLLQTAVIFAVLFFSLQAATLLFAFSPLSLPLMGKLESLALTETTLTEELLAELMPDLMPAYILWAVLAVGVLIFLFYRFRFADLALMSGAPGARAAFRISSRQTRGRRLQLLKLDLHFWWYYGLMLLCAAVSCLDDILPVLGVAVNKDIAFWLFFCLGQLLTLALHIFFTPKVQTSYALFAQGSFQP